MLAVLKKARRKSGDIGETLAHEAADRLYGRVLNGGIGRYHITHYHNSSRLSSEDKKGVDMSFTVFTSDWSRSMTVPVQVKTSRAGAKRHQQDHPDIPCIVVKADSDLEQIIADINACIINKLYGE